MGQPQTKLQASEKWIFKFVLKLSMVEQDLKAGLVLTISNVHVLYII